MSEKIVIKRLTESPEFIPVIADWLYAEWHPFMTGKTIGDVIELFQGRLNEGELPLTYIAFYQDELIGTVSLDTDEKMINTDYGPWISSLYIDTPGRSNGAGSILLKHAEDEAAKLNINEIYTFTAKHINFIQNRGWVLIDKLEKEEPVIHVFKKILTTNE